jgi:hypothetical protein
MNQSDASILLRVGVPQRNVEMGVSNLVLDSASFFAPRHIARPPTLHATPKNKAPQEDKPLFIAANNHNSKGMRCQSKSEGSGLALRFFFAGALREDLGLAKPSVKLDSRMNASKRPSNATTTVEYWAGRELRVVIGTNSHHVYDPRRKEAVGGGELHDIVRRSPKRLMTTSLGKILSGFSWVIWLPLRAGSVGLETRGK